MKLPVFAYIDLVSNILPVTIGALKVRKMEIPVRLFFFLIVLGAGVEVATFIMAHKKMNNLWLIQSYHLMNSCLILYILSMWYRQGIVRKLIRSSIVLYAIVWVIAKSTFEPLSGHDQYTHTTASILILSTVILTLFQLIRDEEKNFLSDCRFWICCGVFFYFTGNFILFSLFEWFTILPFIDAVTVWSIHWGLNAVVNIIYTRAFLLVR